MQCFTCLSLPQAKAGTAALKHSFKFDLSLAIPGAYFYPNRPLTILIKKTEI